MNYDEARAVFSRVMTIRGEYVRTSGITKSQAHQRAIMDVGRDVVSEANSVIHSPANPNWTGGTKGRKMTPKKPAAKQTSPVKEYYAVQGKYRQIADTGFVMSDERMALAINEKLGTITDLRQNLEDEGGYEFIRMSVVSRKGFDECIGYTVVNPKDELMRQLGELQKQMDAIRKDLYG